MRQVLFAGLALVATTPAFSMEDGWAKKLFKEQTAHDFGTVARGAQLYHRFPVTNIYAVPLEITTHSRVVRLRHGDAHAQGAAAAKWLHRNHDGRRAASTGQKPSRCSSPSGRHLSRRQS